MCGIFAVVHSSPQSDAGQKVFAGLQRLEYRGYDSWGVTILDKKELRVEKHIGKITGVKSLGLPGCGVAIGHTRWATHGGVTQNNAHPHLASDSSFALAQNGVVENWLELKSMLIKEKFKFTTQTDTEVIVHLIEHFLRKQKKGEADLRKATLSAFRKLAGRNTIIVLSDQGEVLAARNGSPLLVGYNSATDAYFCSSDVLSLTTEVNSYAVVENGQLIQIKDGKCTCFEMATGAKSSLKFEPLKIRSEAVTKGNYPDFMLKEISETPQVVQQVIAQPQKDLELLAKMIRGARQVYCIGSGTAGVAANQIAFYLRTYAQIPALGLVGADAVEYIPLFGKKDVIIAPSQSGETADVLEVLELAKAKGVKIVTYVNMPASSMTRMADLSFLAHAGPEICVMSTKVFTSQITWGYLVAKTVAGKYEEALKTLEKLRKTSVKYLGDTMHTRKIAHLAKFLLSKKDIFLLAKGENYQIIREGMVKLIEGSYIHAHALPAGDLKHYAITLIEKGVPVIVLTAEDEVKKDVLTAAQEVQARGATVIHIGPAAAEERFPYELEVPDAGEVTSILNLLPLQLLAHELAVLLGHDVDHPRNIAKSVTVK